MPSIKKNISFVTIYPTQVFLNLRIHFLAVGMFGNELQLGKSNLTVMISFTPTDKQLRLVYNNSLSSRFRMLYGLISARRSEKLHQMCTGSLIVFICYFNRKLKHVSATHWLTRSTMIHVWWRKPFHILLRFWCPVALFSRANDWWFPAVRQEISVENKRHFSNSNSKLSAWL